MIVYIYLLKALGMAEITERQYQMGNLGYMYFGMDEASRVFHMMGPKEEIRHITIANEQAVLSPMWSIHSGCGTGSYSFCWSMGGEIQRFDDMDHIAIADLK